MVICGDIIAKLWIRYVGWNFFKPGVLIFYARGDDFLEILCFDRSKQ